MRRHSLSLLLSLLVAASWSTTVAALPRLHPIRIALGVRPARASDFSPFYPWSNEDEQEEAVDKILPAFGSAGTTLYGILLLLYSKHYPGQIHVITMLRATGFDKIEVAVQKARQNIRDAWWSAVWNSPKFFKAKRSYRSTQERMDGVKAILAETKKAKEDGIVTPQEARRIRKLRKKEIARYQKELKNLVRAASGIRRVWEALDLDEIRDIIKGFLFQMMAVLATGHNDNYVGKCISKWCLFLNLGTSFLDVNAKLRFPISKLIHAKTLSSANLNEQQARVIEQTGQVIMFSSAGYLVLKHNVTARELNAASVSSAIVFRGIRTFVETFWDRDDDEDESIWSAGAGFLQGATGGMLKIGLTVAALYCRRQCQRGKMPAPKWLLAPTRAIETAIDKLVLVMDKIM